MDDAHVDDHTDADLGNHAVALRGPDGDRAGDLYVARAERSWTLVLTAEGREWCGQASDLFNALRDLRLRLDQDSIVIGVNGARPECGVSGMLVDMGEGRRAYVLTLPRREGRPETVATLGPAPLDKVTDVATQDDHKRHWLPGGDPRGDIRSGMLIEVVQANITDVEVDVLVTAANSALIGGGGVDGAVHRVAGSELVKALRPLSPCPVGSAVITPAFGFPRPVRHIVHAVGPRYGTDEPAAELLASAYRKSLALADEVGAESIAFPSLSTGAYHYPRLEAAQVSIHALRSATTRVRRCVLVAFDVKTARFWERALSQ